MVIYQELNIFFLLRDLTVFHMESFIFSSDHGFA